MKCPVGRSYVRQKVAVLSIRPRSGERGYG